MKVKTYPFSEKEVKDVEKALNVQFPEQDFERLRQGQYSSLLEDHVMPDRSVKNVKIRLSKDKDGINVHFQEQKETLFIPDAIAGKRLSGADKQVLMDGQILQIKTRNKKNLYIQIDKDLNAVTVSTDYQVGIPDRIGDNRAKGFEGYVLNDTDKNILANGKKMPPKLMCGEQGFFLASISFTPDRTGYIFHDYHSVPENKVGEYIEKYNKPTAEELSIEKTKNPPLSKDNILDQVRNHGFRGMSGSFKTKEELDNFLLKHAILDKYQEWSKLNAEYDLNFQADNNSAMSKIYKQMGEIEKEVADKLKLPLNQGQDIKINRNLDAEFNEAIEKKDFVKLNDLSKEGYKPAEETIKNISAIPGLTDNDRIAIEQLFSIKIEPEVSETLTKIKIDKAETEKGKVVLQAQDKEPGGRGKKEVIGNIINTAFRDIGS